MVRTRLQLREYGADGRTVHVCNTNQTHSLQLSLSSTRRMAASTTLAQSTMIAVQHGYRVEIRGEMSKCRARLGAINKKTYPHQAGERLSSPWWNPEFTAS